MDGARACGGGGDVWRLSHSTRATSDVLCGAVVANSAAGGAAGGAAGIAAGHCIRPAVAFAAGSLIVFIAVVRVAASVAAFGAKPVAAAVAATRATG